MGLKDHLKKQLREGLRGAARGLAGGLQGKTYGQYNQEQKDEKVPCTYCAFRTGSGICPDCEGDGEVTRVEIKSGTEFTTACSPCKKSGKCNVCTGSGLMSPE